MSLKILVVDDDDSLAEMIGIVMTSAGYSCDYCYRGDKVWETFQRFQPDLVLLDVMLPGQSGIEACKQIRSHSNVPIIMLTAKTDSEDVVAGLEAGADDYVPKPFKAKELIARVAARLRGHVSESKQVIKLGNLEINPDTHEVYRDGKILPLTPLEFDLLLVLAKNPQKAFGREELLAQIWGYRHKNSDTRLVNVHIQRLRAKIEVDPEAPKIIRTVRGVGYRAYANNE